MMRCLPVSCSPALTVALGLIACASQENPAPLPPFRVTPGQQWSGGAVLVTSAFFADRPGLPVIRIDSATALTTRIDDSTIRVQLPVLPSATYNLMVEERGAGHTVAQVEIFGYRSTRSVSEQFLDYLQAAEPTGMVVGAVFSMGANRPAILEPSTGAVTIIAGIQQLAQSPGPSARGSMVFVAWDSNRTAGEWQLFPDPVFLDTAPVTSVFPAPRAVAVFGDSIVAAADGKNAVTVSRGLMRSFQLESAARFYLSPLGTRATVSASVTIPGIPVFDMTTGDTAYTLPLQVVTGAAFQADGSVLFAVGGSAPNGRQLFAVDASSGLVIAHDSLPPSSSRGNALTVYGNRLFVAAQDSAGIPQVLAYDAASLAYLGTMAPPSAESCAGFCEAGAITVDPSGETIYYVFGGPTTTILSYDVLP